MGNKRLREILSFIWLGMLISIDIILIGTIYYYQNVIFNFNIDFTKSIELGLLVIKLLGLVVVLVINAKSIKTVMKYSKKKQDYTKDKRKTEQEYKRMNIIKKALFFWRINTARKYMDEYHQRFLKAQKMIGRIRGNETKELIKLKEELIKGILLWVDDYKVTEIHYDKEGNILLTNIPVTREYLETLYLDELYENYAVRCIDTAEKFVNGKTEWEKEIKI